MTRKLTRFLRVYGLLLLAMVVAALMGHDWIRDPGPAGRAGDLANWHNAPGDLGTFASMLSVEVAVLYAMLRPWSYRRSWGRALLALVLCTPPMLVAIVLLIHSGGIMALHAVWLMAVFALLLVCTVVSAIASWTHRHRPTESAA